MDEQSLFDPKPLRRSYSYVGLCYTVLLIASIAAQFAMVWLPYLLAGADNALSQMRSWEWACMTLPQYAVAMPLCYLMMRRFPAQPPQKHPVSAATVFALIPICIFVMYAGNTVGTLLSLWLSGGTAQNEVADLAMDTHPLKFIAMVIAAPIFEEWICRKVLIDRMRHYGVWLSALMSGVIFGLLHQNFFQFFYAFALGVIFSWMYLRYGRILLPILFHMGINFLGAVVAPAVSSLVDWEALEALDANASMEAILAFLPGYMVSLLYSLAMIALAITGLVLLICLRRKITLPDSEDAPPLKKTLLPALCNIGMIVYTLVCAAMFAMSLFA